MFNRLLFSKHLYIPKTYIFSVIIYLMKLIIEITSKVTLIKYSFWASHIANHQISMIVIHDS